MPTDDRPGSSSPPPSPLEPARPELPAAGAAESCDWCGSTDLWWRNCKLLCRGCGGIVKSCADL